MNKKYTPLEALQDLSKLIFIHGGVEQYKIIEKELKAFEIIKEKRVNVLSLSHYIKSGAIDDTPLCWYNEYVALFEDERTLTQEEYDLLKEVLL